MDKTLASFIATLRNADVRISPAETLDALNAVELTGYRDREFLKNTLALVLPKTADEKDTYDTTFEQFFRFAEVSGESSTTLATDGEDGEGEGMAKDRVKATAKAEVPVRPKRATPSAKRDLDSAP